MSDSVLPDRVDRTALRFVDAHDHIAVHDDEWLDYWLAQPVEIRLAGANRCRRRVDGPPQPIDRSAFSLIDSRKTGVW